MLTCNNILLLLVKNAATVGEILCTHIRISNNSNNLNNYKIPRLKRDSNYITAIKSENANLPTTIGIMV